jgi:hypothetical protein
MKLSARTKFVLMFIFFATPITASYLTFFFWKPKSTNNFGELIAPVVELPMQRLDVIDGKDAPVNAAQKGMRGKWLILARDSGACDLECGKKVYSMRQARLLVGKELDRVARVMLVDDGVAPSTKLLQENAGMAFVSAKELNWLAKLPRESTDTTNGRGYIYAVDPMGNLFMRYRADQDIKELAADFRKVLKASQLGKDMENVDPK